MLIRPALAAALNAGKLRLQAQHVLISLDSGQLFKSLDLIYIAALLPH